MACAIICSGTTQADEKALTPAQAMKLIGGQKLITLHLKNATPLEFYKEVWRQTDLPPFEYWRVEQWSAQPSITFDATNTPFWEVMRQVELQYHISADYSRVAKAMQPSQYEKNLSGLAYAKRPFLFVINGISYYSSRSLNFNTGQQPTSVRDRLSLSFSAFGDPQMPWLSPGTKLIFTKAVNDKGVSILTSTPFQSGFPYLGNFNDSTSIPLIPQSVSGGKITHLKGFLQMMLATKIATWEIDDLANAGDMERGVEPKRIDSKAPLDDISYYAVSNVTQIDNGYSLVLKFLRTRTPLDDWAFGNAMKTDLRVLDDKGVELQESGVSGMLWFNENDPLNKKLQGYTYRVRFTRTDKNSADGPVKLIWKYPEEMRAVEVPFEFKNLPLP